jgi:hypothetical protein
MKEKLEAALGMILLMIFLILVWALRIEDPFDEVRELETLRDQLA